MPERRRSEEATAVKEENLTMRSHACRLKTLNAAFLHVMALKHSNFDYLDVERPVELPGNTLLWAHLLLDAVDAVNGGTSSECLESNDIFPTRLGYDLG